MKTNNRKWRYLIERHSLEEIREWNRRLKFFRYFRAYGGHANDSDSFDAAIAYKGENDLIEVFAALGIQPKLFAERPPQPVSGVRYSGAEFEMFPNLVEGTQWIAQPGCTSIFGAPAFVWCYGDRVLISPKSTTLDVGESEVAAAEAMEPYFERLADRIIDPPRDTDHYLCAANYPFLDSEQK